MNKKLKQTIKTLSAALLCLCLSFALFACANASEPNGSDKTLANSPALSSQSADVDTNASSNADDKDYTPSVMALKGPTGMGMAYLMDGKGVGTYDITLATAPDAVVSSFVSKDVDIAAVPINLASSLYNKLDGDLSMLAVNTLGVLYILENGETINDISDLAGKTICATGQASTPEYVLNYILEKNDLEDVTVKYYTDHAELATLMAEGKVDIGMLPEPNVTATMEKNSDLRIALDLTEEWSKVSDARLAQGCIVARQSFIDEHPEIISTFLSDYENSTDFTNTKKAEASKLIAEFEIVPSAKLAKKAIANCNIVCITGEDMQKIANDMFDVLFDANPKSIGGKVPSADFYYIDR